MSDIGNISQLRFSKIQNFGEMNTFLMIHSRKFPNKNSYLHTTTFTKEFECVGRPHKNKKPSRFS